MAKSFIILIKYFFSCCCDPLMKVKFQYFAFFASLLAECSLARQSDCLLGLRYMKETIQEHYLVSMNETKAYIK